MELLYIWVKDFRCIKNAGLNFSDVHRFNFNRETGELHYSKNNVIENFFNIGDSNVIKSLTAIVGNNGAGKSTILNIITAIFSSSLDNLQKEIIFCLKYNNGIYIFSNLVSCIYLESEESVNFYKCKWKDSCKSKIVYKKDMKDDIEESSDIIEQYNNSIKYKTNIIYFSNDFNPQHDNINYQPITDISTSHLIQGYKKREVEMRQANLQKNPIVSYVENDIMHQVEYIVAVKDSFIGFVLPEKINVILKNFEDIERTIYESIDGKYKNYRNQIINQIEEDILKEESNESGSQFLKNLVNLKSAINKNTYDNQDMCEKFKGQFFYAILLSLFYDDVVIHINLDKDEYYNAINSSYNEAFDFKTLDKNLLSEMFLEFFDSLISIKCLEYNKQKLKYCYTYCQKLNKKITYDLLRKLKYDYLEKTVTIPFGEDINEIKDIYKKFIRMTGYYNPFIFSYGISSGEYNSITLFERLYHLLEFDHDKNKGRLKDLYDKSEIVTKKNIILLIDEADLAYHPEWQQKYIKNLVIFLNEFFYDCNIQIILTTHSPILLSDVPKNNCVFLEKRGEYTIVNDDIDETFGSNIYNIYRNGFFLSSNNYGILGEFATQQINEVTNGLNTIISAFKEFDEGNSITYIEYYLDEHENGIMLVCTNTNSIVNNSNVEKYNLTRYRKIIKLIGEPIIGNMLLQKYSQIITRLHIIQRENDKKVIDIMHKFDDLSSSQQKEFISYIVENYKD